MTHASLPKTSVSDSHLFYVYPDLPFYVYTSFNVDADPDPAF
jgi:hypothetical protein